MISAGAVHQNIAGPERFADLLFRGFETVEFKDVCCDTDGSSAVLIDFRGNFFRIFKTEIKDCNFCSAFRERFCHGAAEDSAPAGNNCDFSVQIDFC